MATKKRSGAMKQGAEDERREQIALSPLSACERMREILSLEVDGRLQAVGKTLGTKVDRALLALSLSWRRYVAFSNELATITGKNAYQIRANLGSKIRSYDLRRRLPSGPGLPPEPLPPEAIECLNALRAVTPPRVKKVFEGEVEFQKFLRDNNLVEDDPNASYESPTLTGSSRPSREW